MLLVLQAISPIASGQSWQVSTWHVDDGLPHVNVTAISQTPDGYLWVGTPAGLARFDGLKFKVFRADGTCGLEDSRIVNLLTDREGTLWVGTLGGTLFRLRGQRFETVRHPLPVDEDLGRPTGPWSWGLHSRLLEDSEGGIWWQMTGKGVARCLRGQWRVFTEKDGLPGRIWDLGCDQRGSIWAEGLGKLVQFDGQQWNLRMSLPAGWDSIGFAQQAQDNFWAMEFHGGNFPRGLICRVKENGVRTRGYLPPPPIQPPVKSGPTGVAAMLEDRRGHWWAALGGGGLCRLDEHGQWQRLENQGALGLPWVTCLFEDKQGNLWAGTYEAGLQRIVTEPLSVLPVTEAPDRTLTSCCTRDGAVWVGTRFSGVLRRKDQGFESISGEWNGSVPEICSLVEDSRGNLWAGTTSGLFRYEAGQFQSVKTPLAQGTTVAAIYEDKLGNFWFGTYKGLLSLHAGEFHLYPLNQEIRSLAEDPTGALWVGTIEGGLFRLPVGTSRKLEKVVTYPARRARALHCDPQGTLWVGSWEEGLFRYQAGHFENMMPQGLPTDRIQELVSDRLGTLWVGSANGMFSIPLSVADAYVAGKSPPLLWTRFSMQVPLNQRECTGTGSPVATRTPDGRMWFPNKDNIAVIDPALVQAGLEPANVRIEAVYADGKELPLSGGNALRVSSTTRQFDFRYTALDLTSPSLVVFRTKLKGMDKDWNEVGSSRSARYSKLPPGDYQFYLMAGGADGRWCKAGEAVRLVVVPQWWERRWVQLLAASFVVLTTGTGVLWYQKRKSRAKLQQVQLERKLETERARIARDIHDEMGASLTQIMMLSTLARSADVPAAQNPELDQIYATSRELTRKMDEIVWAVDPRHDTLDSLVNYLGRVAQDLLRAAGVRCRLDIPLLIPEIQLTSQIRHNIFLALKEALNNVIKHASATEARFGLELGDGEFALILEDNGKGFSGAAEPGENGAEPSRDRIFSGNGLKNMSSRAQEARGRLEISSQPRHGTRLVLRIPFTPSPSKT